MSGLYEFSCRVVDCDREGYYFPRWDRATPVTVHATTKQEAVNRACALMGTAPRGRYWGVKVDSVGPVAVAQSNSGDPA